MALRDIPELHLLAGIAVCRVGSFQSLSCTPKWATGYFSDSSAPPHGPPGSRGTLFPMTPKQGSPFSSFLETLSPLLSPGPGSPDPSPHPPAARPLSVHPHPLVGDFPPAP